MAGQGLLLHVAKNVRAVTVSTPPSMCTDTCSTFDYI